MYALDNIEILELLLSCVTALRTEDGVPPAAIQRAIGCNAWVRRRAALCAWVAHWESRAGLALEFQRGYIYIY